MASKAIAAFLTHVAVDQQVAASTHNQALRTLLFLHRDVLNTPLALPSEATRAKKPTRVPTVLTKEETLNVTEHLFGTQRLERFSHPCAAASAPPAFWLALPAPHPALSRRAKHYPHFFIWGRGRF
jgi:hypothetical protein